MASHLSGDTVKNEADQKLIQELPLPVTAFLEQVLTEIETISPLNLVPVTDVIRQD
ncbi:8708_t:CDS:2 [Scutellospora calospora]|uniref:8708_t:CDS:1 n=1 Tax=Scutellospora calospora TaxID=85575 RepID=A0ACA9KI05_9GLOM|nr:8708_t:CDS:2 [Scutellospora calospora]